MANSLTSNPWVIDTPGASILYQTDVKVINFEFTQYGVQGSQCIVQDRFGKVIWVATGAADLSLQRSGNVDWVHGIAVPTLENGGILRVFFK